MYWNMQFEVDLKYNTLIQNIEYILKFRVEFHIQTKIQFWMDGTDHNVNERLQSCIC